MAISLVQADNTMWYKILKIDLNTESSELVFFGYV